MVVLLMQATHLSAQAFYVGGDISLLQRYEDDHVDYYDRQGQRIDDVLAYMKSEAVGWNAQRVRLFVNPGQFSGSSDPAVCQDLAYVIRLGRRIKEAGFAFMLDFHYSDTWADPARQWTPAAWLPLSETELQGRIYEYTKDCLQQLVDAGATPDFIQTGNEVSYGMLWGAKGTTGHRCYTSSDANWPRFIALLKQAGKACREVCPKARIVIHTERTGQPAVLRGIYERLAGVDYDVIGLSYYPFWHGDLQQLSRTLNLLATVFPDKQVQIVETAYYYQWQPQTGKGIDFDFSSRWPVSPEGQASFVRSLVGELKKHRNVNGLYWWFPEENGNGPGNSILNGWVNRGLWDVGTHRALPALYELKEFQPEASAVSRPAIDRPAATGAAASWYTLQGVRLLERHARPGIYIYNGRKHAVR